jgi:hypothetical protein
VRRASPTMVGAIVFAMPGRGAAPPRDRTGGLIVE